MNSERPDDRLLNWIIIIGFSLAFGLVVASLEALHRTDTGFALRFSGWTLLTFVTGAGLLLPCFWLIVYSERLSRRRAALSIVVLVGLGAFFYPMRLVPVEKFRPIFIGLGVAVAALSVLGMLLVLLYRFFEKEEKGATAGDRAGLR